MAPQSHGQFHNPRYPFAAVETHLAAAQDQIGKAKNRSRRPPNDWEQNICSEQELCQEFLVTAKSLTRMCLFQEDELAIQCEMSWPHDIGFLEIFCR